MQESKTHIVQADLNDEQAVDAVYEVLSSQRKRWLALIARHEQDTEAAEELLAAATLKLVVRAQSGFEAGTNLEAYVHTTVMNVVRSHASEEIERRQGGELFAYEMAQAGEDDSLDPLDNTEDSYCADKPEEATARREAMGLLSDALEGVAIKHPQAVQTWRLYCLDELSSEDVAAQQGITLAAVSKQVFNVNQALRKSPKARAAFAAVA